MHPWLICMDFSFINYKNQNYNIFSICHIIRRIISDIDVKYLWDMKAGAAGLYPNGSDYFVAIATKQSKWILGTSSDSPSWSSPQSHHFSHLLAGVSTGDATAFIIPHWSQFLWGDNQCTPEVEGNPELFYTHSGLGTILIFAPNWEKEFPT